MDISKYFNKNKPHHAYLIEGERDEVMPQILEFIGSLGVEASNNSDLYKVSVDSFKIEDARNIKSHAMEKGFSGVRDAKKIFIISANSFLLEAQNSLLKMFEEPIENTFFFLVIPDANSLLKTLVSRFYVVKIDSGRENIGDAEKFIALSLSARISFLKDFLVEEEEVEDVVKMDSTRAKSLRFLNDLEFVLHSWLVNNFSGLLHPTDETFPVQNSLPTSFEHIFKVREFLRTPGSSTKTLIEGVALVIPSFD